MTTETEPEILIEDVAEPVIDGDGAEPEVTTADAAKPEPAKAEDGAAELQRQLDTERQRREAAERTVAKTQEQIALERINGGLAEAEQQLADAKRDLEQAFEAADFKKASDLQEKIGELTASRLQLKQGKAGLEQRIQHQTQRPADGSAPASGDVVETALARFSPRSQDYLRKHKEYVTDPALTQKLTRAHFAALGEGHVPDTDAYFTYIDSRMEPKPAEASKPNGQARRQPLPAAPVSRQSAQGSGERVMVPLTPGQRRAATDGTIVWNYDDPKKGAKKGEPIGTQEYARRIYLDQQQNGGDRAAAEQ